MIKIIPTVVPDSFLSVEATVDAYSKFATVIHIDICDGLFAPNATWTPRGEQFPPRENLTYEAHLMVSDPRAVGLACIRSGAQRVIGHVEAMGEKTGETFSAWKAAGAAEVGLAILADTPLETLDPYIALCDVVQMMSIASIGVQGIPYDPTAPARIAALHARYPDLLIAVDGGVSESNIMELARAGVRRFCVGSTLSKSPDPASTYARLMELAESAIQ